MFENTKDVLKQTIHHLFLWKEAGLHELIDSGGWKPGICVRCDSWM